MTSQNSTFQIFNMSGIKLLTRLRLHVSDLTEHRFRNSLNCIIPVCICGLANEGYKHFFLDCPQYHAIRLNLFDQITDIPQLTSLTLMKAPGAIFFMETPLVLRCITVLSLSSKLPTYTPQVGSMRG